MEIICDDQNISSLYYHNRFEMYAFYVGKLLDLLANSTSGSYHSVGTSVLKILAMHPL